MVGKIEIKLDNLFLNKGNQWKLDGRRMAEYHTEMIEKGSSWLSFHCLCFLIDWWILGFGLLTQVNYISGKQRTVMDI